MLCQKLKKLYQHHLAHLPVMIKQAEGKKKKH